MVEIVSSLSQLINAFKTHHRISSADKEELSHYLLLFYAAECGLKAKYLKAYNGLNTSDFITLPTAKKYGHGHDLWEWIKIMKIPSNGFVEDKANPLFQLHEKLRYGTFSKNLWGNKQIEFLKYLIGILKKDL